MSTELSPSPLRVCPGCGVIAPLHRRSCALCEVELPSSPLIVPGAVGSAVFALVGARYVCAGCHTQTRAPLTFEARAECELCGEHTPLPPDAWTLALELAHDVADLCGPDAGGRVPLRRRTAASANPYESVGVAYTFGTKSFEPELSPLEVVVSPGHPLCPRCRTPLDVSLRGGGRASASCKGCAFRLESALPPRSREAAPTLRAVFDLRPHAERPVKPDAPDRVEPIWVLLDGPSPLRSRLERGAG